MVTNTFVKATLDGMLTVCTAVGAELGPLLVVVTYNTVGEPAMVVVGPVRLVVRSKAEGSTAVAALLVVRPASLVVVLTLAVAATGDPLGTGRLMVHFSELPAASEVVAVAPEFKDTRPVELL